MLSRERVLDNQELLGNYSARSKIYPGSIANWVASSTTDCLATATDYVSATCWLTLGGLSLLSTMTPQSAINQAKLSHFSKYSLIFIYLQIVYMCQQVRRSTTSRQLASYTRDVRVTSDYSNTVCRLIYLDIAARWLLHLALGIQWLRPSLSAYNGSSRRRLTWPSSPARCSSHHQLGLDQVLRVGFQAIDNRGLHLRLFTSHCSENH
jgi:hypothetical protein